MRGKNWYVQIAVVLCALLAAGGIVASNMAFKTNYPLFKAGSHGSKSGVNTLSLPYFRQAGLDDAFALIQDIEDGGPPFSKVISIGKFLEATDSLQAYTGRMGSPGANFALAGGEGYRVQMSADVNYVIVGSHDPALMISLDRPGPGSRSGTNDFAPPYNFAGATAQDLIKDIEGIRAPPTSKVITVSKYLIGSDSLQAYHFGIGSPGANFNLIVGESYRIQVSVSVPYIPSHY